MPDHNSISSKAVGRLSLYRRLANEFRNTGVEHVYSHTLAAEGVTTPAQVRRDLMLLGCSGTPAKGYSVDELIESLNTFFGVDEVQRIALAGVGNLGRALLAYFPARRPNAKILASFDCDPTKRGRVIMGCRCYDIEHISNVIDEMDISMGIIAVPAEAANEIADHFVAAGIRGILNFAPVPLKINDRVHVESMDITMMLDKVVYFVREESHEQDSSS